MKKLFFAVVVICGSKAVQAQDIIYTKRQGAISAKVLEVTTPRIRYKKAENTDGPDYTIPSHHIDSIIYVNGTKDLFAFNGKKLHQRTLKDIEQFSSLANNLISSGFELSSFNLPDAFAPHKEFTPFAGWFVAYERLLVKQKIGASVSAFSAWNRRYYGGSAAVQFYPKSKGRTRFGIGPLLNYSIQNRRFYYLNASSPGSSLVLYPKTHVTALAMNFSFLSNINKQLFIDGDMFTGTTLRERPFKNSASAPWKEDITRNRSKEPAMSFRLSLGYRF